MPRLLNFCHRNLPAPLSPSSTQTPSNPDAARHNFGATLKIHIKITNNHVFPDTSTNYHSSGNITSSSVVQISLSSTSPPSPLPNSASTLHSSIIFLLNFNSKYKKVYEIITNDSDDGTSTSNESSPIRYKVYLRGFGFAESFDPKSY